MRQRSQSQGDKGNGATPGHLDGHQAPEGRPNGRGAEATTAREIATAPALIGSWKESVTGRRRRGTAGTETEKGETEGTGKDDVPVAQTETKTDEKGKEVAAAAGTVGMNAGKKKEMEEMKGAGERTGITIRIEALRGKSPGIRRTEQRRMIGGIKMKGTDTGKTGRQRGQAGVEAETGGIKAEERRRAGRESAATVERETESETENNVLTNAVVAKRGAIISGSPAMITVNIAIAEGVRALSKRQQYYFYSCFSSFSLSVVNHLY